MVPPAEPRPCVACGIPTSGRFCAECGAAQIAATCRVCQKDLTPGARFCHHCGAEAGGGARPPSPKRAPSPVALSEPRSILPWVAGGTAILALLIFVASQQAALDAGSAGGAPEGPASAGRAPDISNMSPSEQAGRLYDRVMRLAAENKPDSAAFFAPMALAAFENLSPFDNDTRYRYGQVAEATGNLPLAGEQAEALLLDNPNHLLGLVLKARVAGASGDSATARRLIEQAATVRDSELAKRLPEYAAHQRDIDAALTGSTR